MQMTWYLRVNRWMTKIFDSQMTHIFQVSLKNNKNIFHFFGSNEITLIYKQTYDFLLKSFLKYDLNIKYILLLYK